jgi:oxygen-independent coproporphyrinogen-3 oxidase
MIHRGDDRPPDERDLAGAVELAPRYDRPGPRYTSYPPAPHFGPAVGPAEARAVYASRGPDAPPLSLYLHLPFCEAMCTYCGCNVIVSRDRAIVDRYLAALLPEIDLVAEALAGGSRRLVQLHLGGGTPTYFPPEALERIHGAIHSAFEITPDAELALEVDPCVTTADHIRTLARLGWRRVSMGVQDFTPEVQEAVNRVQSADLTLDLVRLCREEGFESVNVDLMYGLPHQTVETFQKTLDLVVERIRPDRVSLFGYAHVPWLKAHQRKIDEAALPGRDQRLALFHAGVRTFVTAGYEFIGMDHFARPDDELTRARAEGTLHRNFMGFHTRAGTDMVAMGITGIGDAQGVYIQNHAKLSRWERAVADGELPVHRGYRRTEDDEVRGAIIQELMCNGRVGRRHLAPDGGDWRERYPAEAKDLVPMAADGVVEVDEDGVRLTPLGRLFVRNVCMVFDAHLRARKEQEGEGPAKPRYSRTV